MITVTNIRDTEPGTYDEVWAIVRSPKNAPKWMRHVPELSPSWELFEFYRKKRAALQWTQTVFQTEYVPRFLDELKSQAARERLNELYLRSAKGEHIAVACFCTDTEKCHRAIIASLLEGVGCKVELLGGQIRDEFYLRYAKNKE